MKCTRLQSLNKLSVLQSIRTFSTSHHVFNNAFVDISKLKSIHPNGQLYTKEVDRSQFRHSNEIPDFQFQSQIAHMQEVTPEMSKQKHPLEYVAEHMRRAEDPFNKMSENSLLITNFPIMKVNQDYIEKLVLNADPKAIIQSIHIQNAYEGGTEETIMKRAAYVIVEFRNKASIENVRRVLRTKWNQDKLLKLRTVKDLDQEAFNNRTIIVSNVASHADLTDLVNQFSKFGAITHIELPSLDAVIKAQLEEQGVFKDHYLKVSQKKHEMEYRYSQEILKATQDMESKFDQVIIDNLGAQQAGEMLKFKDKTQYTKFQMLDEERVNSFVRVMEHFQAEGIKVEDSKFALECMLNELNEVKRTGEAKSDIQKVLNSNKDNLQKTLRFLLTNNAALDDAQQAYMKKLVNTEQVDPLYNLQRMSMNELAQAYDNLMSMLKAKEEQIKNHIKESLKYYRKDERVIFESRDFSREQQEMPDIMRNVLSYDQRALDQILGINEQIFNIKSFNERPPEIKLYQWMTNSIDLTYNRNFTDQQIDHARTDDFDHQRFHFFPETMNRTDHKMSGTPYRPFYKKVKKEIIDDYLNRALPAVETPFDEIYQKEIKLVNDIVKAEKAIKLMLEDMPDPAAFMRFDPSLVEEDPEYGNLYSEMEPQYLRDIRRQEQANSKQLFELSEEYQHAYNQKQQKTLQDMIESGQIKRQDYELAKAMKKENRHINLGYAFITFSHAEEADKTLLLTNGSCIIDNSQVEILKKNTLDHSDMDQSYFLRKITNESKIVEYRKELREAKQGLRDFERNLEQEMPKLKKLHQFKAIAQDMIENKKGKTHQSIRRTQREVEELNDKLKQYQANNPHTDISSLFENYHADRARLAMHKRALQHYKQFEFLKGGLTKPKETVGLSNKTRNGEVYEPFKYPGLKDSVASVFTEGTQLKVASVGAHSNYSASRQKKGRRFTGYSNHELLQDYLGKDYASRPDLSQDTYNELFSYQGNLRQLFPDEKKYLQMPKMKEEQQRLKEFIGLNREDGKYIDPVFANYLQRGANESDIPKNFNLDILHPEDEKRSLIKDYNKKVQELMEEQNAKGEPNTYKIADMKKIVEEVAKEYPPQIRATMRQKQFEENEKLLEEVFDQLDKNEEQEEIQVNKQINDIKNQIRQAELLDSGLISISEFAADAKSQSAAQPTKEIELGAKESSKGKSEEKGKAQGKKDKSKDKGQKNNKEVKVANDKTPTKTQQDAEDKAERDYQDFFGLNGKLSDKMEVNDFNFGCDLQKRQSNENLYNVNFAAEKGTFSTSDQSFKDLDLIAEQITQQRRDNFMQFREKYWRMPKEQQVPFYIDEKGDLKSYTKEQLKANKEKYPFDPYYGLQNALLSEAIEVVPEITSVDLLNQIGGSGFIPVTNLDSTIESDFLKYAITQMDELDLAQKSYRDAGLDKSLSQFAEDQEQDIYEKYIHQNKEKVTEIKEQIIQQSKSTKATTKLHEEIRNTILPEPTLESYFDAKSKGKYVFDNYTNIESEQQERDQEMERIRDERDNQNLHRRELLARLYGGTLTPRQFGVLFKLGEEEDEFLGLSKAAEFKQKQDAKLVIGQAEEIIESYRRKMVSSGEWSEKDSHDLLRNKMSELRNEFPTDESIRIYLRDSSKKLRNYIESGFEFDKQEREYYFDEGLGQSLNEHVKDLKSKLKGVEVTTRRDSDGLAIVKMVYTPQFKYDINRIESINPEETEKIANETLNAIFQNEHADPEFWNQLMDSQNDSDLIDVNRAQILDKLIEQRLNGKFKDDLEGFMYEFEKVKKMKNTSDIKLSEFSGNPLTVEGQKALKESALQGIMADQRRYDKEIAMQLKFRMRKKLFGEKRQMQDFVKPSQSENILYRTQTETLEDTVRMLEQDNQWLLQVGDAGKTQADEKDFDVQKYQQVKQEIQMRKQQKERLIAQGFPEFKAFSRF